MTSLATDQGAQPSPMATTAAPRANKADDSMWWQLSFGESVVAVHQAAHGKAPSAPLVPRTFNATFFKVSVARTALRTLSQSKVLQEVELEFEVPRDSSAPVQIFDEATVQQVVLACTDADTAFKVIGQDRGGAQSPFEMCVHVVGRMAEVPKLIAAIKAEKKTQKSEEVKAKQRAKGENSSKSEGTEWMGERG